MDDCGGFTVARGREMEFVEIVRHLVRKHKEVGEQSGVGRFEGRMEARKERKGVPDDQKLSTNGGFWTLPLYGHQLSPLFCPLIQTILALMVFILYMSTVRLPLTHLRLTSLTCDASLSRLEQRRRRTSTRERLYVIEPSGLFDNANRCSSTISFSSSLLWPSSA